MHLPVIQAQTTIGVSTACFTPSLQSLLWFLWLSIPEIPLLSPKSNLGGCLASPSGIQYIQQFICTIQLEVGSLLNKIKLGTARLIVSNYKCLWLRLISRCFLEENANGTKYVSNHNYFTFPCVQACIPSTFIQFIHDFCSVRLVLARLMWSFVVPTTVLTLIFPPPCWWHWPPDSWVSTCKTNTVKTRTWTLEPYTPNSNLIEPA